MTLLRLLAAAMLAAPLLAGAGPQMAGRAHEGPAAAASAFRVSQPGALYRWDGPQEKVAAEQDPGRMRVGSVRPARKDFADPGWQAVAGGYVTGDQIQVLLITKQGLRNVLSDNLCTKVVSCNSQEFVPTILGTLIPSVWLGRVWLQFRDFAQALTTAQRFVFDIWWQQLPHKCTYCVHLPTPSAKTGIHRGNQLKVRYRDLSKVHPLLLANDSSLNSRLVTGTKIVLILSHIFFESTELSFCEIYIVNTTATGFEPTTRRLRDLIPLPLTFKTKRHFLSAFFIAGAGFEIAAARARGGRVIAVGTTVTRTLEAFADGRGGVASGARDVDLYIRPGHRFRAVEALITNFHLPKSSLFVLAAAFAGREHLLAAYEEAIRKGYRFYSYGDSMLVQ